MKNLINAAAFIRGNTVNTVFQATPAPSLCDIIWRLRDVAVIGITPDRFSLQAILPLSSGWFCISLATFMSTAPKIAKLDMARSLTECPEFSALQSHYEAASKFHMRALFDGDPGRFEKFRYNWTWTRLPILICYIVRHLFSSDWRVVQLCFLWPRGSCHNNSLCNEIAEVSR